MSIPYRKLVSLALVVFAASQLLVVVEVTHDGDRTSQVFLSIFFALALVIAALAHQFDRWWATALALAGALLAILSEATYIDHITGTTSVSRTPADSAEKDQLEMIDEQPATGIGMINLMGKQLDITSEPINDKGGYIKIEWSLKRQ